MRESIRKDRARIQVGKISNFGLLEMTRQRLREGFIRWETNLSIESFALKIIKKVEMLAFTNKVKFINVSIPEKVKLFIDAVLKKEIDYFQKKYKFEINFKHEPELIIPEYSIKLLNKSKKIINIVEHLNKIKEIKKDKNISVKTKSYNNVKTPKIKKTEKTRKPLSKVKSKQPRVLWMRRKKKVKLSP
mgnify:FL=1